jgi:16S rRNA (cytosine967-C5)-methyltransferase
MGDAGVTGSRRNHLEKLWREVLSQESLPQLDRWLSEHFRKNSRYGSRDRRWYSELLFAAARHGLVALFLEYSFSRRDAWNRDPAQVEREFLVAYPDPRAIMNGWKSVSMARFFGWVWLRYRVANPGSGESPGFDMSDAEFSFFEKVSQNLCARSDAQALLLWASVPLWLAARAQERAARSQWDDAVHREFFSKQSSRPPLWLRINHVDRAEAIVASLRSEGYNLDTVGQSIRIQSEKGIFSAEAYKSGAVEIQDFASQLAGAAVEARPGEIVWDACSGGGGKTLQIAARLRNRGAVYASDVREFKLEEVKRRARKAEFFNVRCQPWNGLDLPEFPREVQKRGGFDWVLVDAPCTSSGTWRRNPDAKYRVDEKAVSDVVALQIGILANAAKAVAPGGRLVYSTCSWFVDEDEGLVARFLAENPLFKCVFMSLHGAPEVDSDTLFSAVMVRERG